jgi:epoxide hydrolase-like predicted phosphatase
VIKAIIFDVGGVLVRTSNWSLRRKWEYSLGLKPGESDEIVFGRPMGIKAQLGEISDHQLWHWIGQRLDLSASELSTFHRDFWANDELNNELIDLIRILRPNYQTAVLSNFPDNLRQLLAEKYVIADDFDLIVCSAEEGVMKPDAEIYLRTLTRLGCKPSEAIFVDDNEENVSGAQGLGIRAIQFSREVNLKVLLSGLGIQT